MRFAIALLFLLLSGAVHAEEQISAGDLEPDCKLAADGDSKGAVCLMVVDGFVYGFMYGMPQDAPCFQDGGSSRQAVQAFVSYLSSHPERRKDHYAQVLKDAVVSNFCQGR
jgi:hypothetical protein